MFKADIDIQKQIIGDIFLGDDVQKAYIFDNVAPDDFPPGMAKKIFEKAVERYRTGRTVDPVVVSYDFPDNEITLVRKIMLSCCQECVSLDGYKEHCRCLLNDSFSRKLQEYSGELQELAVYNHGVEEIRQKLSEGLTKFDERHNYTVASFNEGCKQFLEGLKSPKEYFKTGIGAIDSVLRISRGDYIIIGARPSVGKTALALQMAMNMATREGTFDNIVFFSFETSTRKIYDRIISNRFTIPMSRIVDNNITPLEQDLIENEINNGEIIPISVVEASGMNVLDIQAEALKRKADVIFIDYIGLILGTETQQISSYERMTQISKDLHTMAQTKKITIIALSQLNREGGRERPTLSNLRDSGQVEQDADAVMLLSRLRVKENTDDLSWRELQIAKNKEGELGAVALEFMGEYQRFNYLEPDRRPEFVD